MQVLVDAREKLDIAWEHPMTEHAANQAILFHSSNDLDVETFRQYAPFINRLWQDKAIRKAYDRRREFQLVTYYFFYCFIFANLLFAIFFIIFCLVYANKSYPHILLTD